MDCLWTFCYHFLYYDLPKIQLRKDDILIFHVDLKIDKNFACFDSLVGAASSSPPEEKLVTTNTKENKLR